MPSQVTVKRVVDGEHRCAAGVAAAWYALDTGCVICATTLLIDLHRRRVELAGFTRRCYMRALYYTVCTAVLPAVLPAAGGPRGTGKWQHDGGVHHDADQDRVSLGAPGPDLRGDRVRRPRSRRERAEPYAPAPGRRQWQLVAAHGTR